MSKIAVVYWSGTGNTEQMANAVAEGAKEAGAEVSTLTADQFSAAKIAEFDAIGDAGRGRVRADVHGL